MTFVFQFICYLFYGSVPSPYPILLSDAGSEMVYGYLITDRPFIPDNLRVQTETGQPNLQEAGR
jgi:hypothetical protein